MAHMVGADPAQLDDLAARMTAAAERLESIRAGIGATLAHSHWDGRDADDFRHLWNHQLAPRLHNAATTTRAGATTVRTNAQQQRDASATAGGGSSFGTGGGQPGRQDGWTIDVAMLGSGLATLATILGAPGKFVDFVLKHQGKPWLPGVADDARKAIEDFFRTHPQLGRADELIKGLKGPLAGLGAALSVHTLLEEYSRDPNSAATFNAAVDTAFGVATVGLLVGAAVFPPAAPVLLVAAGVVTVASFAYTAVTWIDPELPRQIARDIGPAARDAWEGAGHVVDDVREGVGDAVEDVRDAAGASLRVLSGGLNAVSGLFN